jgi:FkbM family methyltransferase
MFHSQDGQDRFLEERVFKGHKNGFFVDVGAHNGISISNGLYFERINNWKGINVEPIKKIYDQLVVNRPDCINLNCAISNTDGTAEFICNDGYTEMISGLKDNYHPSHFQRLDYENKVMGGVTSVINVETRRLESIFDEYGVKHVNYLSIDVEGAEFEVIKSINFDKVYIDVIGFENNYGDTTAPITKYLKDKRYVVMHSAMDILMIHKDSFFNSRSPYIFE